MCLYLITLYREVLNELVHDKCIGKYKVEVDLTSFRLKLKLLYCLYLL
jgi:hypothetical protein